MICEKAGETQYIYSTNTVMQYKRDSTLVVK